MITIIHCLNACVHAALDSWLALPFMLYTPIYVKPYPQYIGWGITKGLDAKFGLKGGASELIECCSAYSICSLE